MALLSNPKELVSQLGELLCEYTGGGVVRVDICWVSCFPVAICRSLFEVCHSFSDVSIHVVLPVFLSVCLYCKAWGNMECVALLVLSLTNCTFKTCLWGAARKSFSLPFLISLLAGKSRLEWRYSWASKNWAKEDWDCWECRLVWVTTFPVTPQPVNGICLWLILHLLSSPLTLYEWPTVSTRQWPLPLLHFIPKFLCAQLGYAYTTSDIQASSLWPQPLIIASLTDLLPCRPF